MKMEKELALEMKIALRAPQPKVWTALTDPAWIEQWMFGTQTESDWKVGSPITFSGTWEGKAYKDQGIIQEIAPEKLLYYTFWSPLSGTENTPENYTHIVYELTSEKDTTILSIRQNTFTNEAELEHWEKNWQLVMDKLKEVVEQE